MRGRLVAIAVLVIVACGAVYFFLTRRDRASAANGANDGDEDDAYAVSPPRAEMPTSTPHDVVAPPIALDKTKRDAMREAIYRAWGMAPPDEKTNPSTWPSAPPSASGEGFGKDYIRERIREDYVPLAKECYSRGLKKNPSLAGKIVTSFRIVGTKGTGGLVDWVDLDSEETTLDDTEVLECLKQSLYSVTFDAPPHDGVVTVTSPIVFTRDEPDH